MWRDGCKKANWHVFSHEMQPKEIKRNYNFHTQTECNHIVRLYYVNGNTSSSLTACLITECSCQYTPDIGLGWSRREMIFLEGTFDGQCTALSNKMECEWYWEARTKMMENWLRYFIITIFFLWIPLSIRTLYLPWMFPFFLFFFVFKVYFFSFLAFTFIGCIGQW